MKYLNSILFTLIATNIICTNTLYANNIKHRHRKQHQHVDQLMYTNTSHNNDIKQHHQKQSQQVNQQIEYFNFTNAKFENGGKHTNTISTFWEIFFQSDKPVSSILNNFLNLVIALHNVMNSTLYKKIYHLLSFSNKNSQAYKQLHDIFDKKITPKSTPFINLKQVIATICNDNNAQNNSQFNDEQYEFLQIFFKQIYSVLKRTSESYVKDKFKEYFKLSEKESIILFFITKLFNMLEYSQCWQVCYEKICDPQQEFILRINNVFSNQRSIKQDTLKNSVPEVIYNTKRVLMYGLTSSNDYKAFKADFVNLAKILFYQITEANEVEFDEITSVLYNKFSSIISLTQDILNVIGKYTIVTDKSNNTISNLADVLYIIDDSQKKSLQQLFNDKNFTNNINYLSNGHKEANYAYIAIQCLPFNQRIVNAFNGLKQMNSVYLDLPYVTHNESTTFIRYNLKKTGEANSELIKISDKFSSILEISNSKTDNNKYAQAIGKLLHTFSESIDRACVQPKIKISANQ